MLKLTKNYIKIFEIFFQQYRNIFDLSEFLNLPYILRFWPKTLIWCLFKFWQGWVDVSIHARIKLSSFFVFSLSNPYPLSSFFLTNYPIRIHYPTFPKPIIQSVSIIQRFQNQLSNPYPLSNIFKSNYPIRIHYPTFPKAIIQSISNIRG